MRMRRSAAARASMRLDMAPGAVRLDPRLYRICRRALLRRSSAEPVVRAVSKAEHVWPALSFGAMLVDPANRQRWAVANGSIVTAFASAKLVSKAVRRRRPYFADCPPASHKGDRQSFPSTHSATAFAALVAVPPLVPAGPIAAAAGVTAACRLMLGQHYPSDVLAGAALGALVAMGVRHRASAADAGAEAPPQSPSTNSSSAALTSSGRS